MNGEYMAIAMLRETAFQTKRGVFSPFMAFGPKLVVVKIQDCVVGARINLGRYVFYSFFLIFLFLIYITIYTLNIFWIQMYQGLKRQLAVDWPNYERGMSDEWLWAH